MRPFSLSQDLLTGIPAIDEQHGELLDRKDSDGRRRDATMVATSGTLDVATQPSSPHP